MDPFSDPRMIAGYAEQASRLVPGYADLQRMAMVLLSEAVPDDGRVLVLGAGGGVELRAFADARPGWRFDGVDPSGAMLDLARTTLGPHAGRARLHEGRIEIAPPGPFDAAACMLTLHFLPRDLRVETARQVRRRLTDGAPFVVAHLSIPVDSREAWLSRYTAFAVASGIGGETAERARAAVGSSLPILTPEEDEAVLREAGFSRVTPFYAAFTFRGWVAHA